MLPAGSAEREVRVPGTEAVPREGETVVFIQGEAQVETEFLVRGVNHVIEDDAVWVQVVLQ